MSTLKMMLIVVLVCVMFVSGCATQTTEGESHSLLPFNISFGIKGALSEGPSEHRIGLGKNSVNQVTQNQTDFNEAWKETGKSKYENIPVTTTYSGPKSASSNISVADRGNVRN